MNATILLLASDPALRTALAGVLQSEGCVVLAVGDVGGAVDRLKEVTPDLLIVRHYTESMTGHDAAVYLRTKAPGVPVLIVGGMLQDAGLEAREEAQGFEVFPKPFTAAELVDKVKEVLASAGRRR
jgi:DNA-binding response OmpR family regulator